MARAHSLAISTLFSALAFGSAAAAQSVYHTSVDPADYSGSRSIGGGGLRVFTGNAPADATISWDITFDGSAFTYQYEFFGFGSDMSHVTLDLTDDFAHPGSGVIIGDLVAVIVDGIMEEKEPEFGDLDGITGAFKVGIPASNDDGFTIEFTSLNMPVWADGYLKGGQFEVVNQHYLDHFDGDSIAGYIALPNGPIPAPGALALLGAAGLVGRRRRRV